MLFDLKLIDEVLLDFVDICGLFFSCGNKVKYPVLSICCPYPCILGILMNISQIFKKILSSDKYQQMNTG